MKILVLCTGNSCRSQMAHGFLQSFDPRLVVCSAGTSPAEKVNPKAVEVMKEVGIDISEHIPNNVENYLGKHWDYVITVCGSANENCPVFIGKIDHRLHIGFEDPSEAIGTPEFINSGFRRIRDKIGKSFRQLYDEKLKSKLDGKDSEK